MTLSQLLTDAIQMARTASAVIAGNDAERYVDVAEAALKFIDQIRAVASGADREAIDVTREELAAAIERVNAHFAKTITELNGE